MASNKRKMEAGDASSSSSKMPRFEVPQDMIIPLSPQTDVRIGIVKNLAMARVSSQRPLREKRPRSPPGFKDYYDTDTKNRGVANTLFFDYEQFAVLAHKMRHSVKVPNLSPMHLTIKYDLWTEAKRLEFDREFARFPYIHSDVPTMLIKKRKMTLKTYKEVGGHNQMDQSLATTGKVVLTYDELVELDKVVGDIAERVQQLHQCHIAVYRIVLQKAGEVLSRMLYSRYRTFTAKQIDNCDQYVMQHLMCAYTEFMCMGYVTDLAAEVRDEFGDRFAPILDYVVRQTVSQLDTLFSSTYIVSPSDANGDDDDEVVYETDDDNDDDEVMEVGNNPRIYNDESDGDRGSRVERAVKIEDVDVKTEAAEEIKTETAENSEAGPVKIKTQHGAGTSKNSDDDDDGGVKTLAKWAWEAVFKDGDSDISFDEEDYDGNDSYDDDTSSSSSDPDIEEDESSSEDIEEDS